jgi:uncharacterized CHY-type Zn-finger protein
MKRSPMKRSAPPPPREAKQCTYTPRARTPAQPVLVADGKARMVVQIPKAQPLRSEAYRRLVASLACISCGVVGQTQCAHSNSPAAGKALALKADDRESFPLCLRCHQSFDQGAMFSKTDRREIEPLWANSTRMKLRRMAEGDAAVRAVVERTIGI